MKPFKLIILLCILISANSLIAQQIKTPPVKKEEPTTKKTTPSAPATTNKLTLKVNPNMRCSLKIDGEDKGIIEKDAIKKIYLAKGEYKIVATSSENPLDAVVTIYTVNQQDLNSEKLYLIDFSKASNERIAKEQADVEKFGTITDARDSKTYKTVNIGTQTWMAENLNYSTGNSWCYDNNTSNCTKYGRLYDWNTARSACPSGWHLPSDAEWSTLTNFVGSEAGKKLKSTSGWNESGNGTDAYGFTALPGGYRGSNESFNDIGSNGFWWSSTEYNTTFAFHRGMSYNSSNVTRYYYKPTNGFSVRCVRDL